MMIRLLVASIAKEPFVLALLVIAPEASSVERAIAR